MLCTCSEAGGTKAGQNFLSFPRKNAAAAEKRDKSGTAFGCFGVDNRPARGYTEIASGVHPNIQKKEEVI